MAGRWKDTSQATRNNNELKACREIQEHLQHALLLNREIKVLGVAQHLALREMRDVVADAANSMSRERYK